MARDAARSRSRASHGRWFSATPSSAPGTRRLTSAGRLANLAALLARSVPTGRAAEFLVRVIGNTMHIAVRHAIPIALLAVLIPAAFGAGPGYAQSGSSGGSIGNDEKSLSGSRESESARP